MHSDYKHEEYGDLDSDYVFVNLWADRIGRAMTYASVDEVVRRTRRRVGFHFTPHVLRHTFATHAARHGVPVEVVSRLLGHRSAQTTSETYLHPTAEDLRAELERTGVLDSLPDVAVSAALPAVAVQGLRSRTHALRGAVRAEFRAEV